MKANKIFYLIVLVVFVSSCYNVIPPFNYYNKFYGAWKIKQYQTLNNQGEWVTVFQDTGRFFFYNALEDITQDHDADCRVHVFFPQNFMLYSSPTFYLIVNNFNWYGSFYWMVYDKSTLILKLRKETASEAKFNFEFNDKYNLILTSSDGKEKWMLTKIPDK